MAPVCSQMPAVLPSRLLPSTYAFSQGPQPPFPCHTHIGNAKRHAGISGRGWGGGRWWLTGEGALYPVSHPRWVWHFGSTGATHTDLSSASGTHPPLSQHRKSHRCRSSADTVVLLLTRARKFTRVQNTRTYTHAFRFQLRPFRSLGNTS